MTENITVGEAIDRLERLLPGTEPWLWESLAPPCTTDDLDALRRAVHPYELADELVELLNWHDGQVWDSPWWPVLNRGPLLGAQSAQEHYGGMNEVNAESEVVEQWRPSWVPITHASWSQAGLELDQPLRGLIIDGSFPDPPRPAAPSLVAVLHAMSDLMEAGIPLKAQEPSELPGHTAAEWQSAHDEVVGHRYKSYGWPVSL